MDFHLKPALKNDFFMAFNVKMENGMGFSELQFPLNVIDMSCL